MMKLPPRVTMPAPNAPCKDCPDRKLACWGSCEQYKQFKAEREALHERIYNSVAKDRAVDGVLINAALRVQKQKGKER